MFSEFGVSKAGGVPSQLLKIKGPDIALKVHGQENLDFSELAFLVESMDITDGIAATEDQIHGGRNIKGLVKAFKRAPEPLFNFAKKSPSSLLGD